jgi:hypothetical protein
VIPVAAFANHVANLAATLTGNSAAQPSSALVSHVEPGQRGIMYAYGTVLPWGNDLGWNRYYIAEDVVCLLNISLIPGFDS